TGAADAVGTSRQASHTTGRRAVATAAMIGAIALCAAAAWHFSPDDSISDALAPLRAISEAAQDDGAGDASTPAAEAERYLPIPAPLDDERVIAALGPIANLSCSKTDYAQSTNVLASPPSDLGPPVANGDATAWLDRSATATAISPADADDAGDVGGPHAETNAPEAEKTLSS